MSNLLMATEEIADEVDGEVLASVAVSPRKNKLKLNSGKATSAGAAQPSALAKETDDTIHSVQNLTKEQALARLAGLVEAHEKTAFELGGVLSLVRANNWFEGEFYQWAHERMGIKRDYARDLMRVYDTIAALGEAGEPFKAVERTKVRVVASVLTKENAAAWFENIKAAKNRAELEEWVRAEKMKLATTNEPEDVSVGGRNGVVQPKAVLKVIKSLQKLTPDELTQSIAGALDGLDAGVRKQVYEMISAKLAEAEAERG